MEIRIKIVRVQVEPKIKTLRVKVNPKIKPLTEKEVVDYLKRNGYPDAEFKDSFLNPPYRAEQHIECVRNGYDLCDFDRWQQVQDLIFGNETDTMKFETALKIDSALWEENIDTMELWTFKDR